MKLETMSTPNQEPTPEYWLETLRPIFEGKKVFGKTQAANHDVVKKNMVVVDSYVGVWLLFEIASAAYVCWYSKFAYLGGILLILMVLRIVEIIQVTVNVSLFHRLSPSRVASVVRILVLAGVNFLELALCFGFIYALHFESLGGTGLFGPASGYYVSFMTQLTNGYSDIFPVGWLRLVAVLQGLLSFAFVILVIGHSISSLPALTEIFSEKKKRK